MHCLPALRHLSRPPVSLRSLLLAVIAAASTLLAACGPDDGAAAANVRLNITGSSTVAPLVAEMARRFESTRPGLRIDVQTGGSSRGVADARRGTADIGMASRGLKPSESGLHSFTIARDGICMIVHASNPVSQLDDGQIRAIYRGDISNWQAVGGRDAPITVVTKAQGRSTLELFLDYFGLDDTALQPDVVIGDNEQGIKTVAGNADALGYVSVGAAAFSASEGVSIRPLPLAGVAPGMETLADGRFPLNRPLNLITAESPRGVVKDFIDYAASPDVHDLVVDLHFVPAR